MRRGTEWLRRNSVRIQWKALNSRRFEPCLYDSEQLIHTSFKKLAKEIYIWSKLKSTRILSLEGFYLEDNSYPSLVSRWMENGTILKYLESSPNADLLKLVSYRSAHPPPFLELVLDRYEGLPKGSHAFI